jgi:hypothetical protein
MWRCHNRNFLILHMLYQISDWAKCREHRVGFKFVPWNQDERALMRPRVGNRQRGIRTDNIVVNHQIDI